MGYEDSVYLAKLAEQAERYQGENHSFAHTYIDVFVANVSWQRWLRT